MSTKLIANEKCDDMYDFFSVPSMALTSVTRVYTADEIQNYEMPHCIMNGKYRPSQMSRNKNLIRATHRVSAIRLCNGVCKNFARMEESDEKLFSPEVTWFDQRIVYAVQSLAVWSIFKYIILACERIEESHNVFYGAVCFPGIYSGMRCTHAISLNYVPL